MTTPLTLAEVVARSRASSATDPNWRTDYVTKTGKVLSDEELDAYADEAERGYDVTEPEPGDEPGDGAHTGCGECRRPASAGHKLDCSRRGVTP